MSTDSKLEHKFRILIGLEKSLYLIGLINKRDFSHDFIIDDLVEYWGLMYE